MFRKFENSSFFLSFLVKRIFINFYQPIFIYFSFFKIAFVLFRSKSISSSISVSSGEKLSKKENRRHHEGLGGQKNSISSSPALLDTHRDSTISNTRTETIAVQETVKERMESENERMDSIEMFQDVLRKISSLGNRGRQMLRKLMDEIDAEGVEGDALRRLVNETMHDERLSSKAKRRQRRDLVLSSPLYRDLTREDEDDDASLEEVSLAFLILISFPLHILNISLKKLESRNLKRTTRKREIREMSEICRSFFFRVCCARTGSRRTEAP